MGRRTIDLSTRNVPRPASPIPSFSQRYHTVGSSAGTTSTDIFVPNCACTVLSIEFQVGQSCTVQLLENSQPASLSQNVTAGAINVFPGRLLANDTKLTITASVSTSVSWHVVWVKDFESELISRVAPDVLGQVVGSYQQVASIDPNPTVIAFPTTAIRGSTVFTPLGYRGCIINVQAQANAATVTLAVQLQRRQFGSANFIVWANYAAVGINNGSDSTITVGLYPTAFNGAIGGAGGGVVNAPVPPVWDLVYTAGGAGFIAGSTVTLHGVTVDWLI